MAVSSEDHMRVYRMVLMQMPKERSFIPLTDELNTLWDEIAASIDPNMGYDIPNEWPDPPMPWQLHKLSVEDEAAEKLRKASGGE